MAEAPTSDDDSATRTGDHFQQEYYVSAAEAGEFLVAIGECLQAGDDVALSGDDWDLAFTYREPVELAVEHVDGDDPELEIELELSAAAGGDSPPTFG